MISGPYYGHPACLYDHFVFRIYGNRNAPADGEIRCYFTPPGLERGDQVVKNHVGHMLMKHPFVTVRPEIQFQGLGFDNLFVRYVLDGQSRKIRLPSSRTDSCKLLSL